MTQNLVETASYGGAGYKPLIQFESWRVAVLNDDPSKYRRENTVDLERHLETDEVFILLSGQCSLYIGGAGDKPENIELLPLESRVFYNVKKGVWHNLIGSPDMTLVIVENADTSVYNSEHIPIGTDMLP